MRTKNIRWVLLLCMAFGIASVAKTQIYSSEDCFYSKEGSSSVSYVVKFEYSKDRVWLKSVSHSTVRSNLAKSEDFYENEVWTDGKNSVTMYEYDSQRSTSAREVYKTETYKYIYDPNCFQCQLGWGVGVGCGAHGKKTTGFKYVAFSTDGKISSFIMWQEKKDNYDGEIKNRQDYTRVPKDDLLPKAVNDDFLY
ncbi:MAG: hypothetical protein J6T81_03625 [Bacteroidales bacterium]|nr:hypothetical protein [Bacteroidales bacterium]